MTRYNTGKINNLVRLAPRGEPLTTTWLRRQGISHKLAWWYVQAGWLERIADGLYCLAEDSITWAGAVAAIQQQLKLSIYPGGKTALQLLGKSHYIHKEIQEVQLFGKPKSRLPRWLKVSCWKAEMKVFRPALFNCDNKAWVTELELGGHTLYVSTPEKASLELCFLVSKEVTFQEAALLIEGLPRMRPQLLQALLENCRSYKAKRLLLFLGDYFNHAWMSELNVSKIDLGKGKRVIAEGGCYNSKYQISIPLIGNSYDNSEAI